MILEGSVSVLTAEHGLPALTQHSQPGPKPIPLPWGSFCPRQPGIGSQEQGYPQVLKRAPWLQPTAGTQPGGQGEAGHLGESVIPAGQACFQTLLQRPWKRRGHQETNSWLRVYITKRTIFGPCSGFSKCIQLIPFLSSEQGSAHTPGYLLILVSPPRPLAPPTLPVLLWR